MTKPLSEMTRSELVDACIKGQQRSADLAAHVEAAKGIMHRLIETECYMRGPRPPAVQEYLDWVYAEPATTLARLKAEWQAEALERCAKGVAACKPGATPRGISISIKMEAEELRRQAEEVS